jgi:hypothetical protein
MSEIYEQYQAARRDEEEARISELLTVAGHILETYRRNILFRSAAGATECLQVFFELLDQGHTAEWLIDRIENYAVWLKGKPGMNPIQFCEKIRECSTEDLY